MGGEPFRVGEAPTPVRTRTARWRRRFVCTCILSTYNRHSAAVWCLWAPRSRGWACLAVADTGIGIAPQHLPHLFERFYRVDEARTRDQGGVGLGLAIADWIVRVHKGRMEVVSTPGTGSTFTVWLPLAAGASGR